MWKGNVNMQIKDLLNKINEFAPLSLAYEWDNCGLLCGREDAMVSGVCVCLDVSKEVIQKAIDNGCNTILSHHPFIFAKISAVDTSSYFGEMFGEVIKNDINVISMHTNIDKAENGINARLAKILDLENVEVLEKDSVYKNAGLGRMGTLKERMTFDKLCTFVGKRLNTSVRATGDKSRKIKKIAIGGGSCFELAPLAIKEGCDAFITGDIKYHQAMDAQRDGICLIDAGHYGTEICVIDIFKELLSEFDVKVVEEKNTDVFAGL